MLNGALDAELVVRLKTIVVWYRMMPPANASSFAHSLGSTVSHVLCMQPFSIFCLLEVANIPMSPLMCICADKIAPM